ncbi:hypothetical protein FRB90_011475 [Tulasnella sp. 427]|nr:hypothetical protein FRB90_011475 [Tulasnella sp. 427]
MERLMDIREALNIVQQNDDNHEERDTYVKKLPKLHEVDIEDKDDSCPICQETFLSVLALEEMATAMDTPSLPEEQLGVTKLECGHRFCRKE